MTPKTPSLSLYAVALADVLLIISLLSNRAERIVGAEVAFWSLEFVALFALAVGACALGAWLAWRGFARLTSWAWVLAVGVGLLLALAGASRLGAYSPYVSPFILWAVLTYGAWLWAILAPSPRWRAALQGAGQMGVSLVVILLILEVFLRVWFVSAGSEADRVNYLYNTETILGTSNRFRGEPYTNFGLSPNHREHSSRGYRHDELITPKPEGQFRIFAVGGSTTYGISLNVGDDYPAQLQAILRANGYSNVEVINAGVPQYATYENLINFQLKILDDAPDMLITYEGINDVITRLVDPQAYTGNNPMRGIWNTEDLYNLPPSTVLRFVGMNLGLIRRPVLLESVLAPTSTVARCEHPTFCANLGLTPLEVLEANPPRYFERNMRHLLLLAQANNVQVVMSTWAYYPLPSNGSLYMTYPHMQLGADQHNDITRALAREFGTPLIDFAESVPDDPELWQDGLHLTAKGAREQAEQYAQFLIENDLLPKPKR
jgi:lysophospholipase L1-like esterase